MAARTVTVPAPPRGSKGRVVAGTALFVLGFSLVFVAVGAAIGGLGHLLTGHERLLTQILGGLTILLGFLFAWFVRAAGPYGEDTSRQTLIVSR